MEENSGLIPTLCFGRINDEAGPRRTTTDDDDDGVAKELMASVSLLPPKKAMALATVVAAHLVGRNGIVGVRAFRAAACSARPPARDDLIRHNDAAPPRSSAGSAAPGAMRPFSFPSAATARLRQQNNDGGGDDGDDGDFEPTWTYVPYKPPPPRKPRRRNFSSSSAWTVPDRIPLPEDKLSISFVRASGAGGQNVNKVSTKAEIRLHLPSADWIPSEVRDRLRENESGRINGEGTLTVTSQVHRTQTKNRRDAMGKLEAMIRDSWARPKQRKMRKGLTKRAKEHRRENKRRVSLKKEGRKRVEF